MEKIEDLIKSGNDLFEKEQYFEAISYYKKLLQKNISDPTKAEIWYKISLAFYFLGRYYNSLNSINAALTLDSNNVNYWLHKAELLQSNRFCCWDEAVESYKKALNLNSDNPDIWIKLGTLFESRNNHKEAIETYNKALELHSNNPKILYCKGCSLNSILYEREKERKLVKLSDNISDEINFLIEILNTYKKVVEQDPNNSDALYCIGVLYTKLQKYIEALHYFDEALKFYSKENEKPTQIWYSKAEVLEKIGKSNEAVELYDRYYAELKRDFEDFFEKRQFKNNL
ncbi:MAG: tetratricopeptide repeat protein [Methanoregulaceae archaeon]|jgi:tetratricopeptide (TPR) repeat protein